ncbi:hypothetical protein [Paenarthrobacter sp.]|uniref:hypothetical protein n=1 Tax=Paenarthrobacter sp. TaxID=1931993 RepID=UPI00281275FD|nr:hypothetical protein [Paenarthrobacter sp.]
MIRVVGTFIALAVVAVPAVGLFPSLQFGDSYLKLLIAAAVAVAVLAGSWAILIHGDLKQRSDYGVALVIALSLLALAEMAHALYGPDWIWAKTCANAPAAAYFAECSEAADIFRYNHNAATLDQITAVLAVSQIVPMLSILKDAVYCWLNPTPWNELRKDEPDANSIRRANVKRGRIPNSSSRRAMQRRSSPLLGSSSTASRRLGASSGSRAVKNDRF